MNGCCLQNEWTKDVYIKWLNELAKMKTIPDYPALRKQQQG